jgi:hypothetical protein
MVSQAGSLATGGQGPPSITVPPTPAPALNPFPNPLRGREMAGQAGSGRHIDDLEGAADNAVRRLEMK